MAAGKNKTIRFITATAVIVVALGYLAWTGIQEGKSYYVTISEMHKMGDDAYTKHLRVAGNVQPGSIHQTGTHADFVLVENDQTLKVSYKGTEPLPDTFKDDAQALALGDFGRDGVFHASEIQAKCASHYEQQQKQQQPPAARPAAATGSGY